MRIRSHLDPIMFIVFLHVDARRYDVAFKKMVQATGWEKGTSLDAVLAALKDRERRVFAHERYHFWQGLRLPFLNLYATVSFGEYFRVARELARTTQDWQSWADLGWSVAGFNRLDIEFALNGDVDGRLAFGADIHCGNKFSIAISAKEMLECAASIFDFQGSCNLVADMSDPEEFAVWRKLTPAYTRIFDFYSRFLASERLALRTILPLINASFHTSFPERAFVELAARVWGSFAKPDAGATAFLAQKEPCRWSELFGIWLKELNYDYPWGRFPSSINLNDSKFYYLDPDRWISGSIGGGIQHPFLGPPAAAWQELAKTTPGLSSYIDVPGYVSNHDAHRFAFSAEPELRIVRVFMDEGGDRVFPLGEGLVGPAFKDDFFSELSASEFRGFILDLLASYGAFRRATSTQMTEAARTCIHQGCPHYDANYCNCYPIIPREFVDCGFPSRMSRWVTVMRG